MNVPARARSLVDTLFKENGGPWKLYLDLTPDDPKYNDMPANYVARDIASQLEARGQGIDGLGEHITRFENLADDQAATDADVEQALDALFDFCDARRIYVGRKGKPLGENWFSDLRGKINSMGEPEWTTRTEKYSDCDSARDRVLRTGAGGKPTKVMRVCSSADSDEIISFGANYVCNWKLNLDHNVPQPLRSKIERMCMDFIANEP